MNLYKVNLEYTIMVLAENETQAEQIAESKIGEDGASIADLVSANEVKDIKEVPEEWRDSIPFGKADDKVCSEILSKII